ncbi:MAG: arylamine N-acetyltransferase, partial [Gammaproteobacteria bacterium]|nr:arylamine N-acetyltransferase [Gammaproteobacteria bacterium]
AMYVFDLSPQYPVDFEMANYYVSTYPESLFLNNLLMGRADVDCRHALQNRSYVKYGLDGSKEEREIKHVDELVELIGNTFNINLDGTVDFEILRQRFEKLD